MTDASGAVRTQGSDPTPGSAGKWMALLAALLGWMFDGFEMGLWPVVGRQAIGSLTGPDTGAAETWFGAIIAVFLVGASLGGVLFGWLGDRLGRVRAMILSVLTYSVFSGLCAFAGEPWHILVLRFVAALGMGGEWSLGVALVMELFPDASRPLLAGLIGAAGNVGFLIVGLLSRGLAEFVEGVGRLLLAAGLPQGQVDHLLADDGWRLLMLSSAAPALLTFFIRLFVPESERWKRATAHGPKARISDIFRGGLARPALLGSALAAVPLVGYWASLGWVPPWTNQMTGGERGTAAMAMICVSIGAIAGTMFGALIADWLSRRLAFFGLSAGALLSCGYLFRVPMEYDAHFLVTTGVAGFFVASFFGWLPLYLPELFPTRVRATGQGFAYNSGRIIAAGCSLMSGELVDLFGKDYQQMGAVMSLVFVTGMILIWFCPETRGRPLPD